MGKKVRVEVEVSPDTLRFAYITETRIARLL